MNPSIFLWLWCSLYHAQTSSIHSNSFLNHSYCLLFLDAHGIFLSSQKKKLFVILLGSMKLIINYGRINIFTVFNLPIQEWGSPFVHTLMPLSDVLEVSSCKSIDFLLELFLGFVALVTGVCSHAEGVDVQFPSFMESTFLRQRLNRGEMNGSFYYS